LRDVGAVIKRLGIQPAPGRNDSCLTVFTDAQLPWPPDPAAEKVFSQLTWLLGRTIGAAISQLRHPSEM
jgi:hypothetical protein